MFKNCIHTECLIPTRGGEFLHKEMSNFKYKNGSILFLMGTDQDQELGTSLDALIITESARFSFDKWLFLRGNINRAKGRILQISTPYFGSEFNDLLDGRHLESGMWNVYKVPADTALNADGTRVYTDKELTRIRQEFDIASYRQEYLVDTKAMNKDSVLGESLEKANRVMPKYDGTDRKMYFSFDIGNSDETVMFTWYEDEFTRVPVLIDKMIQAKTNLQDFIQDAKEKVKYYGIKGYDVVIILPFDSDNELQGYTGKLNRRKELEKDIPDDWNIKLIGRMNIIRLIQVCRRIIETHRISIVDNEIGDFIVRILGSINYKREAKSGKIQLEVNKKSGIHGDHPLDALKYFVAFYFTNMYDEEYEKRVVNEIINKHALSHYQESKFGSSSFGKNPMPNTKTTWLKRGQQ